MSGRVNEQDILNCILDDFTSRGYLNPGTELRKALTRNVKNYADIIKKGNVWTLEQALANPMKCKGQFIEGVNLFRTDRDAVNSALYELADTIGRAKASPAFHEARIKPGQSRDQHAVRTVYGRQGRERKAYQGAQAKERDSLWDQFARAFSPAKQRQTQKQSS